MSVREILDANGKIDPAFLPTILPGGPYLPLVGGTMVGATPAISNAHTLLGVNTIRGSAVVGQDLTIEQTTAGNDVNIQAGASDAVNVDAGTFEVNVANEVLLSAVGVNGITLDTAKLTVNTLPNATGSPLGNLVSYDPTSGELKYQPVPGGGGGVASVGGTAPITSSGGANPVISLDTLGTAGITAYPASLTTDAYGRISSITAGSAPVASVSAGTNISITGTATAPVVNLRAPLTSALDVGTQDITTSTLNADIDFTTNGTGAVHITTAGSTNGALRITQSSAGGSSAPIVNLINTNDNSQAPTMDFYKNSATVQAGDQLGIIGFHGKNASNAKREFARMTVVGNSITAGAEQGYFEFSRMNGSGGGLVSAMGIFPSGIQFYNNPLNGVGTMTAQQVVCPIMTATNATYPKYDANTFVIKDDGIISTIPAPSFEGETYTGVNGGRLPVSFFRQTADLLNQQYCVVEFAGSLWWGGAGYIRQTDFDGNIITTYIVSGNVYALCESGGNLYVGGDFTAINSLTTNRLARIDSTGALFDFVDINGDNGVNGVIFSIIDDSAGIGGIFIGGTFTATGGAGSTTLYRVANGSVGGPWNTYGIQIDDNKVYDLIRFNDGVREVLLIGGDFTLYGGGNSVLNIIGYDLTSFGYFPVGSTFNSYTSFNGPVRSFGKNPASSIVYVGGDFSVIETSARQYFASFAYSDLNNSISDDFPSPVYSIQYDATNNQNYRGGGAYWGIVAGATYSGSPPFTIGLNIEHPQGILPRPSANRVYIPSGLSSANYAYIYEPSAVVSWTSATPIINTSGGADWTNISSPTKGNSFTLKGSITGAGKWYVMSFIGVSFS